MGNQNSWDDLSPSEKAKLESKLSFHQRSTIIDAVDLSTYRIFGPSEEDKREIVKEAINETLKALYENGTITL